MRPPLLTRVRIRHTFYLLEVVVKKREREKKKGGGGDIFLKGLFSFVFKVK
jgi:hypothetical protein